MNKDEMLELHRLKDTGLCFADGCTTPRKYSFLCQNHYRQLKDGSEFHDVGTVPRSPTCYVDGCTYKRKYRYICTSHYKKGVPTDWTDLKATGLVTP